MRGRDGIDIFADDIDRDVCDGATGSEAQAEIGFGSVLLEDGFDEVHLSYRHVADFGILVFCPVGVEGNTMVRGTGSQLSRRLDRLVGSIILFESCHNPCGLGVGFGIAPCLRASWPGLTVATRPIWQPSACRCCSWKKRVSLLR